tara:strand:+ start:35291 stop:36040 length:750 start_codon:yes stop_codon:yes gene_type:complete
MKKDIKFEFLKPKWPAPLNIKAISTKRGHGFSEDNWRGFNFALHVGDKEKDVMKNRSFLMEYLKLRDDPFKLMQVHGNRICELPLTENIEADASTTSIPNQVCAILTADCLPILLTTTNGDRVAAVHAGWRGLVNGIIESSLEKFKGKNPLLAWLGPAIGNQSFKVGGEVRDLFLRNNPKSESSFKEIGNNFWLADIYALARLILEKNGVKNIFGGTHCTYSNIRDFYSYRRESTTGRMATLIWIEEPN